MKNAYVIPVIVLMVLAAGCIGTTQQQVCTEDAKVCPDNRSVGRDPGNNCEFFSCSDGTPIPIEGYGGIGTTNP